MHCPNLIELPSPPFGKTGWPWTEDNSLISNTISDSWPKVTIITPSYNQGYFTEETIRSVLLQGYSNLEYIIIDGGSSDDSVDIIKKYEPWLTYWVSEGDNGQSHAINKGWRKSTGDVLAYLNSDDTYEQGAIIHAVKYLQQYSDVDMVYSDVNLIDHESKIVRPFPAREYDVERYIKDVRYFIPQQGVFFKRRVFDKIGYLDEKLQYRMDRDYFIRIGMSGNVRKIPGCFSNFRTHANAKSTAISVKKLFDESVFVGNRYGASYSFWVYIRLYLELFMRLLIVNPVSSSSRGRKILQFMKKRNLALWS